MSLYSQWQELINAHTSEAELRRFWDGYFKAETEAYKNSFRTQSGVCRPRRGAAQFFGMPAEIFIGFIDGINTSLRSELPLEEIEKDTEIKLDIDFEKLYFNMHAEAKADWLYNLREWDGVLSSERRREITKQWRESKQFRNTEKKIGPNDPCPCGSGKKYKKCCGKIAE